jgi:hypothetical protein
MILKRKIRLVLLYEEYAELLSNFFAFPFVPLPFALAQKQEVQKGSKSFALAKVTKKQREQK